MKKSSLYLIIGIVLILVAFVGDAIISNTVLDFSSPDSLGVEHYICIAVTTLLIIVGIVFVVLSRKIAKKEK
jgi:hypothetical protein